MLIFVEAETPRPLQASTSVAVRSRRGRLDKRPWNTLPDQVGTVESIFVRHAYLGEHCLPFRLLSPSPVVLPIEGSALLNGDGVRIDRFPGLADWWRRAEQAWVMNRSSERLSLAGRIDYHGELTAQFPTPAIRVVYTKAGNNLTASIVTDPLAVIDHKLYWSAASSLAEAQYLTAILNSPALGEIVAPYQSRGAFGARDFDKYVWYPPIPEYDEVSVAHRDLVEVGKRAEVVASDVLVYGGFQRARGLIRDALRDAGLLARADDLLRSILPSC
jgi:hypothetical protein